VIEPFLKDVRAQLRDAVDPDFRDGQRAFFKAEIDNYGVRGAQLHAIARGVYRNVKKWPAADRNQLCTELWKSGRFEEGALVCYVYRRFAPQFGAGEFRMFESWIDRYVRNWAHCDGVSTWLLGACIANEPLLASSLPGWIGSRNRWKRRAAAVSLVPEAKQGRMTDLLRTIADSLRADDDDMVQKGVGWLLKETYPKRQKEVVRWLRIWKSDTPRLVLRYAAEKMSPVDRAAVLS
jgi:3-methyladenine DNA glycosylase AlkD